MLAPKRKDAPLTHLRRTDFEGLPPVRFEGREYVDFSTIGIEYAQRVVRGEEPCCREVKLAAKKFLRMLEESQNERSKYFYSPMHVADVCDFFERLPHTEEGMWVIPTMILEPHVIWEFCAIYGFRRRHNGERLVSRAYIEEPRKNWKSGRAAALGLFELVASEQVQPQILIGAASEKQADRIYKPLRTLVDGFHEGVGPHQEYVNDIAADLRERYSLETTNVQIRCGKNGGFAQRVSSVGEREDGWNPLLVILEELHAQNRDVYEVLRSAFGAKPSALMYMITTAGRNAAGLAWDVRKEMIDVLERRYDDDTVFAAIYTVDEGDLERLSEAGMKVNKVLDIIAKANPMLGVSIDEDKLIDSWREALRQPHMRAEFLRTRLNLWGRSAQAVIRPEKFQACANRDMMHDEFMDYDLYVGLDLASRNDMAALVSLFDLTPSRPGQPHKLALFPEYWVPEGSPAFENPALSNLYNGWAEAGYLNVTPGFMIDFQEIEDRIYELARTFPRFKMLVADDLQANQLVTSLIKRGVPAKVFKKNESNATAPADDLISRVHGGLILHTGNPILEWNFANVHAHRSVKGGIVPKKHDANSDEKIDGFDAAMQANAERMNPDGGDTPEVNVYTQRGILGIT